MQLSASISEYNFQYSSKRWYYSLIKSLKWSLHEERELQLIFNLDLILNFFDVFLKRYTLRRERECLLIYIPLMYIKSIKLTIYWCFLKPDITIVSIHEDPSHMRRDSFFFIINITCLKSVLNKIFFKNLHRKSDPLEYYFVTSIVECTFHLEFVLWCHHLFAIPI